MANQQSEPHDDIIKRMKARVALNQKESERLGHCVACDPTRSLQQKNYGKRTS